MRSYILTIQIGQKKIKSLNDYPLNDNERQAWIDYDKSNPNWLSNLSPDVAKELAQFKGKELIFEHLTGVSEEAIIHLCKFNGTIGLTGAFEITRDTLDLILKSIMQSKLNNEGLKQIIISYYTTKRAMFSDLIENFKDHIHTRYGKVDLDNLSSSLLDSVHIR